MSDPALPPGFVLDDQPETPAQAPQSAPADNSAPVARDDTPALPPGFVEDHTPDQMATVADQPAPVTQDDINDHILKLLNDPKVSGAQLRAYWTSVGGKLNEHDSKVIDDRDAYIASNHQAPTIGVESDPNAKAGSPGLVDNRPYGFEEGAREGVQHVLSNVAGGAGWAINKLGGDTDWGDDSRAYFHQLDAGDQYQGSSAGKLTGEAAASAPAIALAAPVEAGAAAVGLPAAAATGLGLLAVGAGQGALTTHATTPGGVARDAAIGAGSNLVLGKAGEGLAAIASNPTAAAVAGREVLNAADALSRDGLSVRPMPADVGGPLARRTTGALSQGIASGSIIRNRADAYINAIEAAKNRAADTLVPTGETARPITQTASDLLDQSSLGGFRDRARAAANNAYGAAETLSGDPVIQSDRLTNFNKALGSKIAELRNVPGADANPNLGALENIQDDLTHNGYTVSGLRRLRTDLGRQLDATNPDSREIAGALRRPLADDIDANLRAQGQDQAADIWQAADGDYAQSRNTLNDIRKIIGPDNARYSPERIAGRLTALMKGKGGDADLMGRVLNSMNPDGAARVRASLVQSLGRAKPNANNAAGDVFSPETFLTSWQDENFSPAAKAALIPDQGARADLDNIARLGEAARESGKFRNHSNTAGSYNVLNLISKGTAIGTMGTSLIKEAGAGLAAASPTVARVTVRAGEVRPFVNAARVATAVGQKVAPPVEGYLMNLPRPGNPQQQ